MKQAEAGRTGRGEQVRDPRSRTGQKYYIGEIAIPVVRAQEDRIRKLFDLFASELGSKVSILREPARYGSVWCRITLHIASATGQETAASLRASLEHFFGAQVTLTELNLDEDDESTLDEISLQRGMAGDGPVSTVMTITPEIPDDPELTDLVALERFSCNAEFCTGLRSWLENCVIDDLVNAPTGIALVADESLDVTPWLRVILSYLYTLKYTEARRYVTGAAPDSRSTYHIPELLDRRIAAKQTMALRDDTRQVKRFRNERPGNTRMRVSVMTPEQYEKATRGKKIGPTIFGVVFPVKLSIGAIAPEMRASYLDFCRFTGMTAREVAAAKRSLAVAPVAVVSTEQHNGWDELEAMIGLEPVKEQVREIAAFIKARGRENLPSLHMVLRGNPGTAKTTVAHIIGKIFDDCGINKKQGVFVEADRAKMISDHLGGTAKNTSGLIEKAQGGVLFIDEAYALNPHEGRVHGSDIYAEEALSTLVKALEDKRDDFICIMAGYPEQMDAMLRANPGMKSRIAFYLDFPDYDTEECCQIFEKIAGDQGYQVEADARAEVSAYFEHALASKADDFANGRAARKLFERVQFKQALRAADASGDLWITAGDVRAALSCDEFQVVTPPVRPVGFIA